MKRFTKKKKRNSSKQTKNVIIFNYWHVLLLLFNIFISRLFSCKVSVNVLQVEMIGLSNAMHRSWIWNVSSLFWCVSFPRNPFPHRYSDGQGSLFREELIINVAWPTKRQENSKLTSFWILQRVFTSPQRTVPFKCRPCTCIHVHMYA